MKWQPESDFANSYRLVTSEGEIVAEVRCTYDGDWTFGLRKFTDAESAKAAAERSVATS